MLWTLILFAALRYDVGWDYMSYTEIIDDPSEWNDGDTSRFSFFWRVLFSISHDLNFYHLGVVTPNILTYICIYKGLKELGLSRKDQAGALLVYATWYSFYLESFSIIRQALAIGVGFLMFSYIQNGKFVKSIICYVIAIFLHSSSVILIFLYVVYLLRNKMNFKWMLISTAVIIAGIISVKDILNVLSVLDMSNYTWYLGDGDNFGGKIIFVYGFLAIYLMFCLFFNIKNLDSVRLQCFFLSIIAITGSSVVYAVGLSSVISRMFYYFTILMIVILLPSLKIFRQMYNLRIMAALALALYMVVYLVISRSATNASSGYIPYHCILIEQMY